MENNNCVLCLENVIGTKYIEYNHCGRYYLHSQCYDELLLNFKNQCIICRKKIKFINNNFETVEEFENENENEEIEELDQLQSLNGVLIQSRENNHIIIRILKSLCVGTTVFFNFYVMFNLLYFLKLNNLY